MSDLISDQCPSPVANNLPIPLPPRRDLTANGSRKKRRAGEADALTPERRRLREAVRIFAHTYICMEIYMHIYIYMNIHAYIYIYIHTYACIYIINEYTYIFIHTHTHTHTCPKSVCRTLRLVLTNFRFVYCGLITVCCVRFLHDPFSLQAVPDGEGRRKNVSILNLKVFAGASHKVVNQELLRLNSYLEHHGRGREAQKPVPPFPLPPPSVPLPLSLSPYLSHSLSHCPLPFSLSGLSTFPLINLWGKSHLN